MSGRNIWLRILAGTCRDGVYYWFSTLDPGSADPPAWVAASTPSGGTSQWLPIQTVPQIQSGSVDPLEPLASGGRISVVVQSSEAVRAIVAQTLGTSVEARRVGGLTAYAGPGATTFQVSEGATLVDSGYYVIGTEIVQVTDASGLASDPPTVVVARGQLGTWTRGHASVLAGVGTPIVPLDSAQIVGQWAELGVTDGGVDRVVWRGRVRSASASSDQTVSIHLDSLLSVVRDHRPLVPVLLPASIPSEGEPDGDTLRTEVRLTADPGDLPVADWRYARFVGESGDWALLTSNDPGDWAAAVTQDGDVVTMRWGESPGEPLDGVLYVVEVGSSDGVIRLDGVGQIRYAIGEGRGGGRTETIDESLRSTLFEEFFRAILEGLDRVEWATVVPDVVTLGAAGGVVSDLSPVSAIAYVLAGAGSGVAPLPARYAVWAPPLGSADTWFGWQPAAEQIEIPTDEGGARLRMFDPRGRLGEYLADTLLHPLCLCLTDDAGSLRLFSWVEAVRPDSGRAYDTTSGDDRSAAWSWSTDRSPIVATVQIEDPSRDVFVLRSLGTRRRGSSFGGGREDRTVTGRVLEIVSPEALLSGSAGAYELVSPYGVGGDVDAQWESAAGLYSGRIPVLECDVADAPVDDVWVCTQLRVEYPELPTPAATTGWVFACRRDLLSGVARLTVLLPFVGRGEGSCWGPWAEVASILGSGNVSIDNPAGTDEIHWFRDVFEREPLLDELLVLGPDLVQTGTITGVVVASGGGSLTWTGYTGAEPTVGDYLVLPPRPAPVGSPTPIGAWYGYVAGDTPETGDARWQ